MKRIKIAHDRQIRRDLRIAHDLRIVMTIALKDIGDAVRNRTTLSVMLGTVVLMLSSMALPFLAGLNAAPTAVVYDPGRTTLIRALTSREEFQLGIVDSREELEEAVGNTSELRLGLVVPEDLAATVTASQAGDPVRLEGYLPHWADPDDAAALTAYFEKQLAEALWRDVEIDVVGRSVYPRPDTFGQHTMTSHTLAIVVLTVGLALVPGLLVEEKENHTLDALLVSPARYIQIILGKGATGLFYGLIVGLIVYGMNSKWIVDGAIFVVAIGLGTLFAVTVGLLLGVLIENPSASNLWTGLILIVLMVPAFVGNLLRETTPAVIRTGLRAIPTAAFSKLIILSMLRTVRTSDWTVPVVQLALSTLIVAGILVWQVRRRERAA
jgi:ABC-type Na+ efflux pump permease subunit